MKRIKSIILIIIPITLLQFVLNCTSSNKKADNSTIEFDMNSEFFMLSTTSAEYLDQDEYEIPIDRPRSEDKPIGMANPAAVYCRDLGHEYKTINSGQGQKGICKFPDNTECEAWDFYSGKCGQQHSYCSKQGLGIKTMSDGKDPFANEYAVCVSNTGSTINSVSRLTKLAEKATVGSINIQKSDSSIQNKSQILYEEDDFQGSIPDRLDWRNRNGINYLTSVKDQGHCGSCWAFAAAGLVEATYNITMDAKVDEDLSEQFLVSCTGAGSCNGGYAIRAINYIKNYGAPDESCFPYVDNVWDNYQTQACLGFCSDISQRKKFINSITPYYFDPYYNDSVTGIIYALLAGPVHSSISMNGHFEGQIYKCGNSDTSHAVVIVGYDRINNYWIVKNSWGTEWNGDGYFKVAFGDCGIGTNAFSINGYWNPRTCDADKRQVSRNEVGTESFIRNSPLSETQFPMLADETCCSDDDCVLNERCYYGGESNYESTVHEFTDETDLAEIYPNKKLACNNLDTEDYSLWTNLDFNKWLCKEGGYKWHVDKGNADADKNYVQSNIFNDSDFCTYNLSHDTDGVTTQSTECCCGDDFNEFYIMSIFDGSSACCKTADQCVLNGECQGERLDHEICDDGFDNDCDGKKDTQDTECQNINFEVCSDGIDNDFDGRIDCIDPDCDKQPIKNYFYDPTYYNMEIDNEPWYDDFSYNWSTSQNYEIQITNPWMISFDIYHDFNNDRLTHPSRVYLSLSNNEGYFEERLLNIADAEKIGPNRLRFEIYDLPKGPMWIGIAGYQYCFLNCTSWAISDFLVTSKDFISCGMNSCEGHLMCLNGSPTCSSYGKRLYPTCDTCSRDGMMENHLCPKIDVDPYIQGNLLD